MRKLSHVVFTLSVLATTVLAYVNDLQMVFEMKQLQFEFPTQQDHDDAIANGNYIQGNCVPIDVQPYINSQGELNIFMTVPRFAQGVPATLATLAQSAGSTVPTLQPFPNYEWHSSHGSNCDGITSALRIAIDECNRLWVIDSGVIGSDQRCPPQLLLLDGDTGELINRYRLPSTVYTPGTSLFITPVVITHDPPPYGKCKNSIVYMADVTGHGIVMYDSKHDMSWRAENKFMYPNPDFGTHTIAGETFTLMDGIFGMSTDKRNLYFNPLASTSVFAVPLSVLDNRSNWVNGVDAMQNEFKLVGNRGIQSAMQAMDSRGNLFGVTFDSISLMYFNVNKPFNQQNVRVLSNDSNVLQFCSGMKVFKNAAGRYQLWMNTNKFQKIATGTMNKNVTNFRVMYRDLSDIN